MAEQEKKVVIDKKAIKMQKLSEKPLSEYTEAVASAEGKPEAGSAAALVASAGFARDIVALSDGWTADGVASCQLLYRWSCRYQQQPPEVPWCYQQFPLLRPCIDGRGAGSQPYG